MPWGGIAVWPSSAGTAKTIALTAIDLFMNPDIVEAGKAERRKRIGEGWVYTSLVGDRAPPLDYRKAPSQ